MGDEVAVNSAVHAPCRPGCRSGREIHLQQRKPPSAAETRESRLTPFVLSPLLSHLHPLLTPAYTKLRLAHREDPTLFTTRTLHHAMLPRFSLFTRLAAPRLPSPLPAHHHHHHHHQRLLHSTTAAAMSSSSSNSNGGSKEADHSPAVTGNKPATLPAPGGASDPSTPVLDISGGDSTVSLDAMGPVVVNKDGTVSRVTNWGKMTEMERETTLRVLGKRNKQRLAALKEAEKASSNQ